MNRLIIAGIGVVAIALLATGCGGGGGDEATAAQVSKAQFYKQARAVCAATQKKIDAELSASKNTAAAYSILARLRGNEAEELDAITGSDAVEEEVKPFIANILKASQLIAREGRAAAGDPSIEAYGQEAVALHLTGC